MIALIPSVSRGDREGVRAGTVQQEKEKKRRWREEEEEEIVTGRPVVEKKERALFYQWREIKRRDIGTE